MRKYNNRKETLNNNNINTTKYFSLSLPEGLKPGSKITLSISEDGTPVFMDEMEKKITEDGYVNNNRLFRRWVMAQMFKMLNYKAHDGREGFNAALNDWYGYDYQFKMMLNEIHALAKMEKDGGEDFEIRKSFFTPLTVAQTIYDYAQKLEKYAYSRPFQIKNKRAYVKVAGRCYWLNEIKGKLTPKFYEYAVEAQHAKNYRVLETIMRSFMSEMIRLPRDTAKSGAWNNAFKGAGAYYTLQNLIRFHGVRIVFNFMGTKIRLSLADSEEYLEEKRKEYIGEGYKLFAFMKEVIDDNDFDFNKRMNEIYR